MSMGYPAAQGYTGSSRNPTPSSSSSGMSFSDWGKTGATAAAGLGRSWANWQNSVASEESLRKVERDALYNADQTRKRTAYEAWRNDVYARRTLGQQRNAFAVSGVDLSGTAIDDLVATMQELTLNKEIGIAEGLTQESMYRAQATDAAKAAKKAKRNRYIGLGMDWVTTGMEMAGSLSGGASGAGGGA